MKRVLLFLLLAGGGMLAVWGTSGGAGAPPTPPPRPATSPTTPTPPPPAGTPPAGTPPAGTAPGGAHDTRDLPMAKGTPPAQISPTGPVRFQANPEPRTWVSRVTGETLVFPAFVAWDFAAEGTEPVRGAGSGDSGFVARRVRLRVYRDPKEYSEDTARSLHADREGRPGPVEFEVTSDTARADFLRLAVGGGERIAGVKTTIHLDGNVVIQDFAQDQVIRTDKAHVDVDHDFVYGDQSVVAESPRSSEAVPDWRLTGVGFRVQGEGRSAHVQVRTLTIDSEADLDVRRLAGGSASMTLVEPGGGGFRPTHVTSQGPAVVTRAAAPEGGYRVVLRKDAHVEQEEGARLSAETITLDLEPSGSSSPGPAPAGGSSRGSLRLRSLLAETDVLVTDPSSAGGLRIAAPKMTSLIPPAGGVATTTFDGHTTLSYEGDVATLGRPPEAGTVDAVCEERMTFGPSPTGVPRVTRALRLVGRAHVASRSAGEDPQTIDGDEVLLLLGAAEPPKASVTVATGASPVPARSTGRVIGFEARGSVRLAGPRITGVADVLVARDLDLPTFLVTADTSGGRPAHLAVAAETRPAAKPEKGPGAAPAAGGAPKAPARTWAPEAFAARGRVVGHVRAQTSSGEEPLTLEGDALDYARARGGRLWSDGGRDARMTLPGEASRDGSVVAPSIGFRLDGDDRSLWTEGATRAVVWTGTGAAAAKTSRVAVAHGVERFGARSTRRIEIEGATTVDGPSMAVRVHDGGALERLEGDTVTDRLEAREVAATLVQRVVVPGESTFFGGRREGAPKSAAPSATPGAAAAPASKPPEPERWTLSAAKRLAIAFSDAGAPGAMGGLRSLAASGAVDAKSDTMRLEGETLAIDGATSEVTVVAAPGRRARVTSGKEADGKLQRIVAPRGTFTLDPQKRGAIKTARFQAPVAGALHDRDAKTGKESRVLLVSDTGDLVIVDGKASVDAGSGVVTATMSRKEAGEKAFQPPITLTTPRLTIYPTTVAAPAAPRPAGAASGKAPAPPPFDRLTAEGPGTRLDIAGAEGTPPTRAIGQRIVYDGRASRVQVAADPGKRVYLVRQGLEASFVTLTYDPSTDSWDGVGTDAEIEDTTPEKDAK